jgi:DNA polymerase IIIc chi subunit
MKIDFMKVHDEFLGHCLINAITNKQEAIEEVVTNSKDGMYEVQFIVNGVELPLEKTFKDIEKQIDGIVQKKAYQLLKEKFTDLLDITYEITEDLRRKGKERLNLDYEED